MAEKPFAAFFSYVHKDDEHDSGRLSKIREWLEEEIGAQVGKSFEIFQDHEDIHWGQAWEERLNDALDGCTFLIAVITPRYLQSEYCRQEFLRFTEREKKLERNDLVLPLLYLDTPALANKADPVAVAISSRQYADFRDLRLEPWSNPDVQKRLSQLARAIRDAVNASQLQAQQPPKSKRDVETDDAPEESSNKDQGVERKPSSRVEPPTLVVDPMPKRGDFTTLTQAIEHAEPGTRILIHPGLYKEAIALVKPLELIGDGERSEIIVEMAGADVILFETEFGRVANLTLRQTGGDEFYAVDIARGRLELEDCDITSLSLACVAIHDGADPRLRRNRVHDGSQRGVLVYDNGKGTLEDNELSGHAYSGIHIKTEGNPTLRRNRIHSNKQDGVFVYDHGRGMLEENDIWANGLSGVEISAAGNPTLRRNRIHDGLASGVFVHDDGGGTLEENEIWANAFSGVTIKTGGNPTLRRNRIYEGKQNGVMVFESGRGLLEDNDIFENTCTGIIIKEGGMPVVRNNRIVRNKHSGILILTASGGIVESNDLRGNREPLKIDALSKKVVKLSGNIASDTE